VRTVLVIVTVACLGLISSSGFAQQPTQMNPQTNHARAARRHASPAPGAGAPLYQRRDSWYEFLLKQFNPDNVDYGAWLQQRRQALLEASVRNPYFRYSACLSLALLVLSWLYAKQQIDRRRSLWITAEMMTDLYNHDAYSRRVARDAIQKYNDHIERCNRAVEAAEHNLAIGGMDLDADRYRVELQSVTADRDANKRECESVKSELAARERMVTDLSLRLDALAKKSAGDRDAPASVDVRTADQILVQHINTLQEQLYAEKRENKRLKSA
jgi:hypothetical protein